MLGVTLTALAMDGMASTGVVLPLLIFADLLAASTFRSHIQWKEIRRLLPPIFVGLWIGWFFMTQLRDQRQMFRPLVGWMVAVLLIMQLVRQWFPRLDAALPHSRGFGIFMGLAVGFTTMVANAAGPVASLYLLILALPKAEMVHTMAWLFLIVNLIKVPFSYQMGLINGGSLMLNVCQAPAVVAGLFAGKWIVERLAQATFQNLVLILAGGSAIWLILS
jgi:uncharacterized membrane protein YfcA